MGCSQSNTGVIPVPSQPGVSTKATSTKAAELVAINTETPLSSTRPSGASSKGSSSKGGTGPARIFDDNYTQGKVLGSGGYSTAVEAVNKHSKATVAAKITKKRQLTEDDIVSIKSEISILKSISHPNIIKYIDDFEDEDHFYVCLELMSGGELFDRIVKKLQYDESEARDLIVAILTAIKYLHDRDIVHRDLKPENLLLLNTEDDTSVKIADFGFAKVANGFSLATQCGSPGYVAPEILLKHKYGKPVDMWAMGVITYIILAGYPPFSDDGGKISVMFDKIKKAQYQFDEEYWSNISIEAKNLIQGMLTLDPNRRITAAQALQHPWICSKSKSELKSVNLGENLERLRKFNANRKFKAAAKAIIAVNKMQQLLGGGGGGSPKQSQRDGVVDGNGGGGHVAKIEFSFDDLDDGTAAAAESSRPAEATTAATN